MKDFMLRAAVRKLWDWDGGEIDKVLADIERLGKKPLSDYRSGQLSMCQAVRREMRTLFVGLIDFDE